MSQDYIDCEVDKIFSNNDFKDSLRPAMAGAWIIGNFKGLNLKVLDVRKTSSLADYFIIASATNLNQAKSMANEIVVQIKNHGVNPLSKEGFNDTDWVLIDFGDVIFHIFQEISRDVYDLDGLWSDASPVKIPDEYYFSEGDNKPEISKDKSNLDFF